MQRLDQPLAGASSIEPAAEHLKSTGETYVFDYALRPEVDLRAYEARALAAAHPVAIQSCVVGQLCWADQRVQFAISADA